MANVRRAVPKAAPQTAVEPQPGTNPVEALKAHLGTLEGHLADLERRLKFLELRIL